jgi:hypothetical protein
MIRCAMLRHAEMPKGSRRVPTVYDGFILGLPHGALGRFLFACIVQDKDRAHPPAAWVLPPALRQGAAPRGFCPK